ncbi:MAG: O-antigen ligase family protein [Elusimicrobiota bacterium]|nr:O-antigen ligase family protein [Endomicrobiia bacterium]MDW8165034.1 O-antigen ligase family protein [Elusimicrobiota bacterium]
MKLNIKNIGLSIIKISIVIFAIFVSFSISAIGISVGLLSLGYIIFCASQKRFFYFSSYKRLLYITGLFVIVLILSTIFSYDVPSSIKRTGTILGYFVLLFSGSLLEKSYAKKIFYIFLFFIIFHSIYSILQYFTGLDIINKGYQKYQRVIGLAGHFNSLAGVMGLVFPLVFCLFYYLKDKREKFIYVFSSLFILLSIILTFTRGIWLGVLLFFIFFAISLDKKFFLFFFIMIILLFGIPSSRSRILRTFTIQESVRKEFLKITPTLIIKRPILGYGPDSFRKVFYQKYPDFSEKGHFHPHNMYLHILFEVGVLGLGLFLYLFLEVLKNLISIYKLSTDVYYKTFSLGVLGSVIVFLVYGLVDEPFRAHYAPYVLFFLLSLNYNFSETQK